MKLRTIRYPDYQDEQLEVLAGIQQRDKSEIIRDAVRTSLQEAATIHPEVAAIAQAAAQTFLEKRLEEIKDEFGEEVLSKLYLPTE